MKVQKSTGEEKMKTKIVYLVFVLTFAVLLVNSANAALWIDYHLDIYDGDVYDGEMFIINPGSADMYGGSVGKLEFRGSTTGNIYGGEMDWLWTDDTSTVNIYYAEINMLAPRPDSVVYLYSYDTTYHPDGGNNNNPWLEGKFVTDDSQFLFTLYHHDCIDHIVIVPEPGTLLLFSFGVFILRQCKRRNSN